MTKVLVTICLSFLLTKLADAQLKEQVARPLKGGNYKSSEGGVFLKIVPSRGLSRMRAYEAEVKLIHTRSFVLYRFSVNILEDLNKVARVFKVPTGEYKIASVTVNTERGAFIFNGPTTDTFSVYSGKATDAGRWYAIERKRKKLALILNNNRKVENKVKSSPRQPSPSGVPLLPSQRVGAVETPPPHRKPVTNTKRMLKAPKLPSSRTSGASLPQRIGEKPKPREFNKQSIPKVQESRPVTTKPKKFRPRPKTRPKKTVKLSKKSRNIRSLPVVTPKKQKVYNEIRATYSQTRTIAMFYRIDIKRFSQYTSQFQSVIHENDSAIRGCYIDGLEDNPRLEGIIRFKFLYSRKEKSFRTLKVAKETLNDSKVVDCVYWEVAGLSFKVNKDLLGDLTFDFSTR